MAQPVWITPAGNLGTVPEGVFYENILQAIEPGSGNVFYQVIAGDLPLGIEISTSGLIQGIPSANVRVGSEQIQTGRDVVSKFAVRAYTTTIVAGRPVVSRIADRTFSLTIAGQNYPQWVTPAGLVDTLIEGTYLSPGLQLLYKTNNNSSQPDVSLISGALPPGLSITPKGLISGVVIPNPGVNALAGYSRDAQGYDQYAFDFSQQSISYTYQFTLQVTDGQTSALRTFSIFVLSTNIFNASTTEITADNTFIKASASSIPSPIILNPQGSIGTARNDNFYAYQFFAEVVSGDQLEFSIVNPPPGLTLDPVSGWLFGYIPNLGLTELTYDFTVFAYSTVTAGLISEPYNYSITFIGPISTNITWLTDSDLGVLANGATSRLYVEAVATSGLPLQYQLAPGTPVTAAGIVVGLTYRITKLGDTTGPNVTDWNTIAGTVGIDYKVGDAINAVNLGTGTGEVFPYVPGVYNKLPQGLRLLPNGLIVGRVSFNTFALDQGTTTFDRGATTFDSTFTFTVNAFSINGLISVFKTFTIVIDRVFNEPYNDLYIECMPPRDDRLLISNLLQNPQVFPNNLLYRPDDPNFGLSDGPVYRHAYGLRAATLDTYVESLELNHYWKNLVLGNIKTARALDLVTGETIYEVVYSEVIDNLVNPDGVAVGKLVPLAYPIDPGTPEEINVVYPNPFKAMRDQVIDVVGQVSNVLPDWMLTEQSDGTILGFRPAWVIAYTIPGASGQIAYNITSQFGTDLNLVDFKADRYELDRSLSAAWNPEVLQLTITGITANGVESVVTFAAQLAAPFEPGDMIRVTGVTPDFFDGTFYVDTCTTSSVTFASDRVGTYVSGGMVSSTPTWIPYPATSVTFDIEPHYSTPTQSFDANGAGYAIGDEILILGSDLGGIDGDNDLRITVNTVGSVGNILNAFYTGTASILSIGETYANVSGSIVVGGGTFVGNITAASTTINAISSFDGLMLGQSVSGNGISAAATITTINEMSGNIVISAPATASGQVTIGYKGSGALWTIEVVPGVETIFDDGSMQFTAPADINTDTQIHDRYLLYPKQNILR
jgi:hypothetical protein